MEKSKTFSKMWFLLVMLVAFVAGCGGNDSASPSSGKAVTSFSVAGSTGTVDESAKTIAVTMPNGTNVTAQAATFTTSGSGVTVGTVVQSSGTTTNNFTAPVKYTVTAADGTTATYTVTVTVAPITAKAITSYSLAGVDGTINETAKTISVTLPSGSSVTALVATFTTTAAGVKVGPVVQKSGTTANNFTSPVTYTVTAGDTTTATYNVTVTVAQASAKAITAYSLGGVAGTISEASKTIAVTMPNGKNVTALVATFATTGTSVKVAAVAQQSGTTANNFTSPVAYTVTAADNTIATYTVTVTVAANSSKAISAYTLAGVTGTINETLKTIAVTMPNGTNVTALVASFTTSGTGVKVGTTVQVNGATQNNFTAPVAYIVTAADNSTVTYTVTVTQAPAKGPAAVNLGTAGNYVILAKSAISTTGVTAVTGDLGLSPSAASFITGFALIADSTNTFSTSSLVTGQLFAATYAPPTPTILTTAVLDMMTAYTDAAGRAPDVTELGSGNIGGMTLVPGTYKWGTGVLIPSDITLSGGPNDVWIFEIAQDLVMSSATRINLIGGAQAKNIFWQVFGIVDIGTTAHFEGIALVQTAITLKTGATVKGRLLAQTAVSLDSSTVTAP